MVSKFSLTETVPAYFPCTKVLILNPRVGLTLLTSSPLSHLRIVVFPALSRPLRSFRSRKYHYISLQEKDTHFPLFFSVLADNSEEPHVVVEVTAA